MKHDVSRTLPSLGLLFLAPVLAWAQLPVPQLTSVFPPGGKQGDAVEVVIAGVDLDDADQLVFSHPGISATPKMGPTTELEKTARPLANTFTVQIAGSVPPGLHEVRAITRFGMTTPRAFAVSTQTELTDAAGNNAPDKALETPVGSVVSGRVDASQFDYFKLSLKAKQRIIIDCFAQRLDSRLDGALAVYNAAGKELARVADTVGLDPVVDFTAPSDGTYTIRLRDSVYGGGADFFYRLAVLDAPRVDFVFPPAAVPGSSGSFTLYGRNLPGGQPAEGLSIAGAPLQKLPVTIAAPADGSAFSVGERAPPRLVWTDSFEYRLTTPQGVANPVNVYFAKAPVVSEKEPNNTPQQAQLVTAPCTFCGQFFPQRDVDFVRFEAKKGQVFSIDVTSHQLGLECDPTLSLMKVVKNEKGEETITDITQVDDPQDRATRIGADFDYSTDDPSYRFTVPEDAVYQVMIRDQFGDGRANADYVYMLSIRPLAPDFRLAAISETPFFGQRNANLSDPSSAVVMKGGSAAVEVTVNRTDDFKGEVAISVEGLPSGVTCSGAVAGGDTRTVSLVLIAAENAASWTGPIKIVGKAQIDGKEVSRESRYGSGVWGTKNRQQQLPDYRLTRGFQLNVIDKTTQPAFVAIGEDKIHETSLGANFEIPIKLTRRGEFKEAVKLTATGLPNELKPKEVNLAAGAGDAKFELQLNQANIKPGAYTFYMKGESKWKYARNPDAVTRAEADQKALDETIKQINEQIKQLTEAKTKAEGDAKTKADADLKAAQAKLAEATKLKTATDKRLADAKTANTPKDLNFALVSTPVRLRILPAPYKATAENAALKQGDKAPVTVKLEKLFGFDDAVELTFDPPAGVAGLSAAKVSIAKGQAEGKLELAAAANATPGEHKGVIRAKGRFNNVAVEEVATITLKVEAVEAKK